MISKLNAMRATHETPGLTYRLARSRSVARRGQTVVFALLVLLILSFTGALFISIVTRNLQNAGQATDVVNADFYAQAGIDFADSQLTNSTDGADWRPPHQTVATNDPDFNLINYNATSNPHPFTRFNYGNGRFLLRITYDPVNLFSSTAAENVLTTPGLNLQDSDRYIKIESIGRVGAVDPSDPTTFFHASQGTDSAIVAYKQIGLTDYGTFITDPNRTGKVAEVGVPSVIGNGGAGDPLVITPGIQDFTATGGTTLTNIPIPMNFGAADAYSLNGGVLGINYQAGREYTAPNANYVGGGGSFRSNTSVRFFGLNNFYLDRIDSSATASALPLIYDESVQVAGNIFEDGYGNLGDPATFATPAGTAGTDASLVNLNTYALNAGTLQETAAQFVHASTDESNTGQTLFDTYGGAIRDGSNTNDSESPSQPRAVTYLPPPAMDTVDPYSQLPRYRALTMNSTPLTAFHYYDLGNAFTVANPLAAAGPSPWSNGSPSAYGYGRFTYINNFGDVQPEDTGGGVTPLSNEWLNEGGSHWIGNDIYEPPAVEICFGPQPYNTPINAPANFRYGYSITRSDMSKASGATQKTPIPWYDPTTGAPKVIQPTQFPTQTLTLYYADLGADNAPASGISNDVIIYAEGNVRLSGIVSADPNDPKANVDDKYPRHITVVTNGTAYIDGSLLKGNPDSTIAVLAHDYVCVNTTQFFMGKHVPQYYYPAQDPSGNAITYPTGYPWPNAVATTNPNTLALSNTGGIEMLQQFNFGLPDGMTVGGAYGAGNVYLYFAGNTTAGSGVPVFYFSNPNLAAAPPAYAPAVPATNFARTTLSVDGAGGFDALNESPTTEFGETGIMNVQRVAMLPNDVRIEAVLFAQTKSFFVIPGRWFNTQDDDNVGTPDDLKTFSTIRETPSAGAINPFHLYSFATGGQTGSEANDRYPFYGQPVDMKITIAGTIVEAMPADIGSESQWMHHWGWIPQYHGSIIPGYAGGTPERSPHAPSLTGHGNEDDAFPNINLAIPATVQAGAGLTLIYDPYAGAPYDPGTVGYLRTDSYGNPLPFAPKLPVCPGLIYQNVQQGIAYR